MPNGAQITNGYDGVSRLENRQVTSGSTVLSAWTDIAYDDNGNRLSELTSQRKLDGSGARTGTATYGYDQLDRLISNHHPFDAGDTKVGYKLDNAGNVMAESAVDGPASDIQGFVPTSFGYTNNRLTDRAPSGEDALSYQYDLSGNQSFEREGTAEPPVGTANSYDAASHPARTTTPDGKWAEYTYDGLGRQVTRRTDSGETTLVFHFGLVDQPAVEQTTGGSEDPATTRYLLNSFGAPLGQQVTVHAGPDVVSSSYFVPDLRGNLSQLLGSGSSVKAIFGYDAYGKPKQDLDGSGDPTDDSLTNLAAGSDSRLRYQMAPHDPLTGNYNLGPRLLNPNINRFVGADFYAAGAANMALQVDPLTGNRYMYAGANPARLLDDGHRCKVMTSFWTWGNCEDDTNAFVSGSRDAVKVLNAGSGWLATGASLVTVVCPFPCGAISAPVAGFAGVVNIGTGIVIAADECGIRKQHCVEASANLALGGATRKLSSAFNAAIKEQAPEIADQIRFGLNAANTVGSVGTGQAAAQSAAGTASTGAASPVVSPAEVGRQSADHALRKPLVMEAGRQRLREVRSALGDPTPV